MLFDDGDIVRGLGFVTLYSAWIEEALDGLLHTMATVEPFDERKQRWPISRKLKSAIELVRRLNSGDFDSLLKALEAAVLLFEKRNELVHGRIYAGRDQNDYIQSGRLNIPTRPITSAELYELANKFWAHKGKIIGLQFPHLSRAVKAFQNGRFKLRHKSGR